MIELYVVTDGNISEKSHVEQAKLSYEGGADAVQLRDKKGNYETVLSEAKEISEISKKMNKIFIVNDSLDIALKSGADGVHLGKCDGSVSEAKRIAPEGFIVGASVESVEDAIKAEKDGADYVALSPVFDTATKKDAHEGYGLEMLSEIRKNVSIDVIAIGGINENNVDSVLSNGADGVAVISAVVGKKDIKSAAENLKKIIRASKANQ